MSGLPEEGAPIACVACKVDSAPAHQTKKTGFVAHPEKSLDKSAHYEKLDFACGLSLSLPLGSSINEELSEIY